MWTKKLRIIQHLLASRHSGNKHVPTNLVLFDKLSDLPNRRRFIGGILVRMSDERKEILPIPVLHFIIYRSLSIRSQVNYISVTVAIYHKLTWRCGICNLGGKRRPSNGRRLVADSWKTVLGLEMSSALDPSPRVYISLLPSTFVW